MSAIEHVVVLMMENRSFDEYFGTFPGVAGFTPSTKLPWPSQPGGVLYPWRLSTFTSNALHAPILEHDWISNHLAINVDPDSGIPDNAGFYITSQHNPAAMGCYLADDIPYYWALAQAFALCDHYFCSVLAGTYPNRMFLAGGTVTDPSSTPPAFGIYQSSETGGPQYNGTDPVLYNFGGQYGQAMPGVANVPSVPSVTNPPQWGSYLGDLRNSSADGSLYRVYDDWNWQFGGTTSPLSGPVGVPDLNMFYYYQPYQAPSGQIMLGTPDDTSYFAAHYKPNPGVAPNDPRPLFAQHVYPANPAQAPFLAPLTWILPPWNYSDHPIYTSADASYYVAQIVDALMGSEFWESTVLIITYDESNTHFDHLPPPLSPDPRQVLDGLRPPPFEPWVEDNSGTISELDGVAYAIGYPAPIGAGMRVPTIIVSPWTYQRGIVSDQLDHTSILQLMETVSGVPCSGLPAQDSDFGWRRANFANLHQVIDADNAQATPARQITGVPRAPTVAQWQANANMRLARQSGKGPVPPASSQDVPPVPQACTLTLNPGSYDAVSVLAQAAGQPAVTFPGAVTVVVNGFQPQEFVEPFAGASPLTATLPEVPVAGGASTCRTRVPVPQIVSGASPGEIIIGSCSQVSDDPNLHTDQQEPQEPLPLTFTFPLTFTNTALSFAFRQGTSRVLGLQAVFTVDASVTAAAELTLVNGTLKLPQPQACMMLAGRIAEAEKAVYAASQAPPGPGSAAQLHAAELALGKLQAQYAKECGSGSASGPAGPFPPGIPG